MNFEILNIRKDANTLCVYHVERKSTYLVSVNLGDIGFRVNNLVIAINTWY